jgi:hypothetical protein
MEFLNDVIFITIFICIFFFTLGETLHKDMIKSQMEFLFNDFTEIINLLGPNTNKELKNRLSNIKNVEYKKEDEKIYENNTKLKMICFILSLVVLCLGYYFKIINFNKINIYLIVTVILMNIFFMKFFIGKYIAIEPNLIKYNIIMNMKKIYK